MSLQTDPSSSTLLTAALEKLLYLESRLDSVEASRDEAVRDRDRQRIAAQAARQALLEWQKRATDAEVTAEGAEREVSLLRQSVSHARRPPAEELDADVSTRLREAQDRLARYDREREVWLDRMVVLGRLHHQGDELDLGSFIAELRSELLALRRGETRRGATVSDRPAAVDPAKLLEDAPAGVPEIDPAALLKHARLSRPERTLATICARDLRSDSASVRRRAAERLAEGEIGALNPLAITLLPTEPDLHVRIALIKLLGTTGGETADIAVARALADADSRVRAAALEALARRDGVGFQSALDDVDPAVRRRAVALLPRRPDSVELLATALRDPDASVRHVAVLSLARQGGHEAVALLQSASESADPEVNRAANDALRRRQMAAVTPPVEEAVLDATRDVTLEAPTPELDARVREEIRTSLRGRTLDELASRLETSGDETQAAVSRLVSAGALVWRGRKLYLA